MLCVYEDSAIETEGNTLLVRGETCAELKMHYSPLNFHCRNLLGYTRTYIYLMCTYTSLPVVPGSAHRCSHCRDLS